MALFPFFSPVFFFSLGFSGWFLLTYPEVYGSFLLLCLICYRSYPVNFLFHQLISQFQDLFFALFKSMKFFTSLSTNFNIWVICGCVFIKWFFSWVCVTFSFLVIFYCVFKIAFCWFWLWILLVPSEGRNQLYQMITHNYT